MISPLSAQAEREAIVAWLRRRAARMRSYADTRRALGPHQATSAHTLDRASFNLATVADQIAASEHHRIGDQL